MKFITLTPVEFTKFANRSPYKSFLQTVEIAKLREKNGWTAYHFGVERNGKLVAATMAVAKPTFLGKSTYYIPGGPLLDYEDTELVDFFFRHLRQYAKSHNGYVLHIEPYYEIKRYDRDGEELKDYPSHESAIKNLKNLGFRKINSDNPNYLFILELKNTPKDKLFASFKQNTRNLISRTARKGVKVRELGREELDIFKQITQSTSDRRHFTDKPLSYYQTMYDLFAKKGQVKFIVAEIDGCNAGVTSGTKGIRSAAARGVAPVTRGDGLTGRAPRSTSCSCLAVAMFMTYGDEVIYLFSGSEEKYMKEFNAQYAIQWHMIQYALEHKFKKYNFYGIQGLPDPSKPGYGIYKSKKGFTTPDNGYISELIGAYELPVNQPFYQAHQLLSKIRHH